MPPMPKVNSNRGMNKLPADITVSGHLRGRGKNSKPIKPKKSKAAT